MKKVKICGENYLEVGKEFNIISKIPDQSEKITLVCFENDFSEEKYYLKFVNEEFINKVVLIGSKPQTNFGKKIKVAKNFKKKYLQGSQRIIFLINTDLDEDVLRPLVQIFKIAKEEEVPVGIGNLIGFSYKTNSDLLKTLEALLQEDLYKEYEVVYDYLCEELDKKFADNSICQFEDNRCIANRKHYDKAKVMGCCYSFDYNGLYFSNVKLCEHQKDKRCGVKCLGCKLFTCDYLRDHGIRFTLEKMPIALAFFTKKQREALRTTFFVEKEVVIEKVMKI